MTTIRAKVDGAIRIDPGVPEKLRARIERAFTFANPAYHKMIAVGRMHTNEPETFEGYKISGDGTLVLPRGAPKRIAKALEGKAAIEWIDKRTKGGQIEIPKRHDQGDLPIKLRDYQAEAVDLSARKTQGLIVIGCGGGKTTIGACLIERLRRTAVILVHTEDLLEQWVETMRDRLGIEAGIIGGGHFKPAPITIAMIQTLRQNLGNTLVWDALNAGVTILDEAHHAPASTFRTVLEHCPSRWRIGLTATPTREDGLTRLMEWNFGERLIERHSSDLIKAGHLMKPEIEVVKTDFVFESNTEDKLKRANEIRSELETYEPRQHLIATMAAKQIKEGQSVMVLANRKAYAKRLTDLINGYGSPAELVTGETPKKKRKAMILAFRKNEIPCIVATSLANEGLDVPKLSRLIFAWPEKARGSTDQRAGRLMRLANKIPILVDIVDARVPELLRQYEARARAYRKIGAEAPRARDLE